MTLRIERSSLKCGAHTSARIFADSGSASVHPLKSRSIAKIGIASLHSSPSSVAARRRLAQAGVARARARVQASRETIHAAAAAWMTTPAPLAGSKAGAGRGECGRGQPPLACRHAAHALRVLHGPTPRGGRRLALGRRPGRSRAGHHPALPQAPPAAAQGAGRRPPPPRSALPRRVLVAPPHHQPRPFGPARRHASGALGANTSYDGRGASFADVRLDKQQASSPDAPLRGRNPAHAGRRTFTPRAYADARQ